MVRRSVDMKRGAASIVHRAIWARDSSKLRPKFPMISWGQRKGAISAGLLREVGTSPFAQHVAKARAGRDRGERCTWRRGSAHTAKGH